MKLISYLQDTYNLSRRKIVGLIKSGYIYIDKSKIESYKAEIQVGSHIVIESLNIDAIVQNIIDKRILILFNKPLGYVVSKDDENNQTIYEILPPEFINYYYIGRLDKNSHGLLLLTNDPSIVNQYSHPKFQIQKKYIVSLDYSLTKTDLEKCILGVENDNDILKFGSIQCLDLQSHTYQIILSEGKKRHIRRVFQSLNNRVLDLQRIEEGIYSLGNIPLGGWQQIDL